jgi:hypothetical protein
MSSIRMPVRHTGVNWMTESMTETTNGAEDAEALSGTVMAEDDDPLHFRPWTIKSVPVWLIDLAREAASKERLPMGRWLARVLPLVVGPNGEGHPGNPKVSQLPAVIQPPADPGQPKVSQIAEIAAVAKQLSEIEGLPESVLKEAHGLLRDKLRAARRGGEPPKKRTENAKLAAPRPVEPSEIKEMDTAA